ncbi:MAG: aminodeoxychorismate/anthranilate synthase component II [Kordiimonadaceae bacterium]|jgi:anthranilate synthase component II|nr:aminodeoxychorismate/anthranilate synthase component II [Kordiimonadaceae bacterium]
MFILIDNYDSFTYNLYHYLGEIGADVDVYRNDEITVDSLIALKPQGIILSPGPKTPDQAGICLEIIERMGQTTPILGVCLGHQSIGQVYGGKVIRAPYLMHGKVSDILHENKTIFKGFKNPFGATRYHSLIVERENLPDCLEITSETEDGIIMGLSHKEYPVHGVQFHPESIASEHGHDLFKNFVNIAATFNNGTA